MAKVSSLGPVGTKLGSFIINDQLETKNDYYNVAQYDKFLRNSIEIGLSWLRKHVPTLGTVKYKNLLVSVEEQFIRSKYTESLNQRVIELSYDVLSKINDTSTPTVQRKFSEGHKNSENKSKIKIDNHLGALSLDKITLIDVDTTKFIMVETQPGNFILCLNVKHNDHWDCIPYKYIAEKIPNFSINFQNF